MNKRFKRFSKIFAMILTLTMIWSVSVSAKDIERKGEYKETKTLNSTISPRASYYGYSWHNAGESRTNRFTVSGTGARMGMTLKVESFNPSTMIGVNVYNSSGTLLFNVVSWIGDNLSTGHTYEAKGSVTGSSYYTIEYTVIGLDSSGRVVAWTY